MADSQPMIVLLAGANGFAGRCTLEALLAAPEVARVFAITRRPLLNLEHPRLANRIVQFERLEEQLKGSSCHVAVSCLGTTLQKAGSEQEYRRVLRDHVLAFARSARAAGAQRFILVSGIAWERRGRLLTARIRNELTPALESLGFASVDLLLPGPLTGWREPFGARDLAMLIAMPLLNPFLVGERAALRALPGKTLGAAVVGAIRSGRRGVQRYAHAGIRALALSRARASAAVAVASSPRSR